MLIEPPQNLTGSVAGPSELLDEPAHPFFIKGQKIRGNCVRGEGVSFVTHGAAYHSLKKWNKA
jgi:hypothetical protein